MNNITQYKVKTKLFEEDKSDSYIIGIDPGTKNGLSIYSNTHNKFLFCKTYGWWDLITFLESFTTDYSVVIEDVISNKPTFKRGMIFGAIKSGDPKKIAMSIAIFDRFAQDVGGTKRDQEHLLEWFDKYNIETYKVVPKKNTKTKLNHDGFMKLTGITTRLNEHTRDSVMLVRYHLSIK